MTDKPILFRGQMVQAQMGDAKTETRRLAWRPRKDTDKRVASGCTQIPTPWQHLKPGDRLWVRERTMVNHVMPEGINVVYVADNTYTNTPIPFPERLKFKPEVGKCLSMGCYREASRLTWIVGAVRVEPLQAITREDAAAEGMCWEGFLKEPPAWFRNINFTEQNYKSLWQAMHGKDSWWENPEVVVITASAIFKENIDALGR